MHTCEYCDSTDAIIIPFDPNPRAICNECWDKSRIVVNEEFNLAKRNTLHHHTHYPYNADLECVF